MKKYLPVILFLIGILFLVGVFVIVKSKTKKTDSETPQKEAIIQVSPEQKPIASLTPSSDGHWLKLTITKLLIDAQTLDYELLYKLPDGRTQGVPGTIDLLGEDEIERDLLLGSESSGKFRYDNGVESGSLTLRLRNSKGKLISRFATDFQLQSGNKELTSLDGNFKYELKKPQPKAFFVVMETFGFPDDLRGIPGKGPYGVFSSIEGKLPGSVTLLGSEEVALWDGSKWTSLSDKSSSDIGIFVGL